MKLYFTSIREEIQRFYKDIKYKIKHIAESNEELCYFYVFNKNYNDLRFRLKFLRKIYPDYVGFQFFVGMDLLINGNRVEALKQFEDVEKAIPSHPFAKYYIKVLKDKLQGDLPQEVVIDHFNIVAPFYTQLDKIEREAYIKQIVNNFNLFKLEQDQIATLDLGCGNGFTTKSIARFLGKIPIITGVEIAKRMVDKANQCKLLNGLNLYKTIHTEDVHSFLNNDSEKYDLVLCLNLINYLNDLPKFFSAIEARILNSASILIGFEFDDRVEGRAFSKDYMKYVYSRDYIKELLRASNLRVVNEPLQASSGYVLYVVKKNS